MPAHTRTVWPDIQNARLRHQLGGSLGAPRVATDIRIGTRVDRDLSSGGGNDAKVARVQEILARDHK
ncbi:hypothetical protein E4T56_gene17213 [Termitomyces sp. T112]|nr:hypothetical protein E4T56_gene17213 [Termitomyces sp. T112]